MNSYPLFYDLADRIQDRKQIIEVMQQQQNYFQLNPYKVDKLSSQIAKKIYSQILTKYQITKQFKIMENSWQENQRRVFVWYIIIFLKLENIDPSQYVHYHQFQKQINWNSLKKIFFHKKAQFLEFQFSNLIKGKGKILWTQEENEILLQAIEKEKPGKWNEVSKRIFYQSGLKLFKSPKHCRQRWFNHLDKTKNKGAWTLKQDFFIFKFIIENGKRWATIVKSLQNSRTQHMIKNRYNSLIAKFKKNKKKREEQVAQIAFRSLQSQLRSEKKQQKLKQVQKNNYKTIQNQNNQINNQLQNKQLKSLENNFDEKQQNSTGKLIQAKIESTELKYFTQNQIMSEQQAQNQQLIECLKNNTNYNSSNFNYTDLNSYGMFYCYENTSINLLNGYWNAPYMPLYQVTGLF